MSTVIQQPALKANPFLTDTALICGRKYRLTAGTTYTLPTAPAAGDSLEVTGLNSTVSAGTNDINTAGQKTLLIVGHTFFYWNAAANSWTAAAPRNSSPQRYV